MKVENVIQAIVSAVCVAMLMWLLQTCHTPQPIVQTKEVLVELRMNYDTVNGKFYTNAGTGEFILGPLVI